MMSDDNSPKPQAPWMKNLAIWAVIVLGLIVAVSMMGNTGNADEKVIGYSEFISRVDDGAVKEVEIQGQELRGNLSNGQPFVTYAPDDPRLVERLQEKGVTFNAQPAEGRSLLAAILINMLPMALLIGIWIFFMRQM
ncbi:MAG: ATP-dependent metallopeptidase FtsH/Yme1/Tma family protein, partial [Pacificimonas sp.]